MSGSQIDNILQEMIRERDAFAVFSREKIAQMDAAIQARKTASEGFNFQASGLSHTAETVARKEPEVSPEFVGLAYPAMVHRVLTLQPERSPLTVDGILEVMALHGVVPESKDARHTVQTALNRRKTKNGDIIHTGLGEWGLKDWYTPSDLEKFAMAQNGANARDASRHKQAMKRGIAAVKARGAHYGKPPKITEEMWNLTIRLYVDEGRSWDYIHEKVCELFEDGEEPISKPSLYNRRKQFSDREPYPARWKAYFDSRAKAERAKKEVEGRPSLRAVE
jgi:hypothetical protein